MKKVKNPTLLKTTSGRKGWHSAITGEKVPDLKRKNEGVRMDLIYEFLNKQWDVLDNFKNKLDRELRRYVEQSSNTKNNFVFQLDVPLALGELPSLLLKLKGEPVQPTSRFFFYSEKSKAEAIKQIEDFLKSLGLTPIPQPSEIRELLSKWETA